MWAPSPLHQQPWSFVVIRGEAAKAKVKELCLASQQAVADADGPGWAGKYSFAYLDQAPVYVAVFLDPKKAGLGAFFGQSQGALAAASAAVQNLMLAATEQGLGSLWLTFFDPKAMAQALGAPEGLEVGGHHPPGRARRKTQGPRPASHPRFLPTSTVNSPTSPTRRARLLIREGGPAIFRPPSALAPPVLSCAALGVKLGK